VAGATLSAVRPALKAGLLPVWRDRDTVQIGIDPRRAVALTGMAGAAPVLALLDGSRDRAEVIGAAARLGIPEPVTSRILTLLAAAGALDDYPLAAIRALPPGRRQRLSAELAAAALARGHSDAGATALARRDGAAVRVYGPGRLATTIADILATSGVGRVGIADLVRRPSPHRPGTYLANTAGAVSTAAGPASADATSSTAAPSTAASNARTAPRVAVSAGGADAAPGRTPASGSAPGLGGGRPGRKDRARPDPGPGGGRPGRRDRARPAPTVPDLAVVTGRAGPGLRSWLMRAGVPHLAVAADEAIGVVGPLVRPGQTACLRCLDITRASLDPAWPLILAQVTGRAAEPAACDAALVTAVAAQAAGQALAFLDRAQAVHPAENGTLELVLPGWQWRRRSWPRPAACNCRQRPAA
jgi:hypothetical protein